MFFANRLRSLHNSCHSKSNINNELSHGRVGQWKNSGLICHCLMLSGSHCASAWGTGNMDVNVRASGLHVKWKCHSDKERTFRSQECVCVCACARLCVRWVGSILRRHAVNPHHELQITSRTMTYTHMHAHLDLFLVAEYFPGVYSYGCSSNVESHVGI